jgi:multidrug efflux pump subunit AcrA (membrane-fusion protein)
MDALLMKASHKSVFILFICSLFLFVSGCSLLPKEEQELEPPLIQPAKESSEIFEVKEGTITKQVKGVGFFEATKVEYHQFTEPGGTVEEVHVKAGDIVKKGDVLIQLKIDNLDLVYKEQQLELEKAKMSLQQAKAEQNPEMIKIRLMELDIAQLKFNKTSQRLASKQLIAKMDGQVIFVDTIKPFDQINDHRILVSIADPTQLRLVYETASSASIESVQVGMNAELKYGGETLEGTVVQTPSSAPATDNKQLSDLYAKTLYIEMDSIPADVLIGDTADVVIITEQRENTVILPRRGLRSYLGRNYVHIMDGESRQEVDVEVGIETATEVEILTGLQAGQKVILQ